MKAPKVLEHIKPVHVTCPKEDIAPLVIMPGDPLRAKYIAENFLSDAKLVNDTRNMFAYTGTYKGTRVTVMGSGMGMPSMGIYSFELYYYYGVEKIIRVGTCGALIPEVNVPDIIVADSAYNEGNFAYSYNGDPTHLVYPSKELTNTINETALENDMHVYNGTIITMEQFTFYMDNDHAIARIPKTIRGVAEEMEAFALFHTADSFDKQAACILTVVDSKFNEEFLSEEEREKSLNESITLALESIIK